MREVIPTPVPGLDLGREYGHHQSPAIRAGGMVFCSGMVAIDPQSGERQHGTVTSEVERGQGRGKKLGGCGRVGEQSHAHPKTVRVLRQLPPHSLQLLNDQLRVIGQG